MKVSQINCPGCGATVPIVPQEEVVFCAYCGNSFHLEKRDRTQSDSRASGSPSGSSQESSRLADQLRLQMLDSEIAVLESAMDECLANIEHFKAYESLLRVQKLDGTLVINTIGSLNTEEIRHAELSNTQSKLLQEVVQIRSRLGLPPLDQETSKEAGSAKLDFCFHCGESVGIDDKQCVSCNESLV